MDVQVPQELLQSLPQRERFVPAKKGTKRLRDLLLSGAIRVEGAANCEMD